MSDARTTIPTAPPTGVALLEAVDVRKTYQLGATQVPVLHGATLSLLRTSNRVTRGITQRSNAPCDQNLAVAPWGRIHFVHCLHVCRGTRRWT